MLDNFFDKNTKIMDPWAILYFPEEVVEKPIIVNKPIFSIGRSSKSDLTISTNRLLSSIHCRLELRNGSAFLTDSSTNGTIVNGSRVKQASCILRDKDTVNLIQRGSTADLSFKISLLLGDNEEDNKPTMLLDATLGTDEDSVDDVTESVLQTSTPTAKRKADTAVVPGENKMRKMTEITASPVVDDTQVLLDHERDGVAAEAYGAIREGRIPSNIRDENNRTFEHSKHSKIQDEGLREKIIDGDDNTEIGNDSKAGNTFPVDVLNEPVLESKKESLKGPHLDSEPNSSKEQTVSETKPKNPPPPMPMDAGDDMLENLQCSICYDIIHDCVCIQPCLHCFCAGCYSEWMQKSKICPQCRGKVDRICKNHIVNNIIESYLKLHSDRRRDEQDLKELDEKNRITADMIYPKKTKRRRSSAERGSDDDSDLGSSDDTDGSSDDNGDPQRGAFAAFARPIFGAVAGVCYPGFHQPNAPRPYVAVCRQCAGYQNPHVVAPAGQGRKGGKGTNGKQSLPLDNAQPSTSNTGQRPSTSAVPGGPVSPITGNSPQKPSTSGTKSPLHAAAPKKVHMDYVCPPGGNHVMCTCCMEPMPRRPADAADELPPTKCTICQNVFCHLYWKCMKPGCRGCLGQFSEMQFGDNSLAGIILDNAVESRILRDHLTNKGQTWRELLLTCVAKLDSGEFKVLNGNFTSQSVVCYKCGLRNFQQLAYQFRQQINKEELPVEVTSRPDCYWGSQCRTQKNKILHAERFNHICQQTRFN